ncbi:hypothetical protein MIR68_002202 [Amoeboaphelidium protococcarum]|nr:hypothetical protein MIR68_002202 [Amoeboaphelidium protococcarum]
MTVALKIANNSIDIPFTLLSEYDDVLTDILIDQLYLDFKVPKMRQRYVSKKIDLNKVVEVIRSCAVNGDFETAADSLKSQFDQTKWGSLIFRNKTEEQKLWFKEHCKRYLSMYHVKAGYDIVSTTKYGHDKQAAVIASRPWRVGETMECATGYISPLTEEDELKIGDKDFSVIHVARKKCASLLLGPARLVNHDCRPNVEFTALGQSAITFKIIRDIKVGDEILTSYSKSYFGNNNSLCMCYSCEKRQQGAYRFLLAPALTTSRRGSSASQASLESIDDSSARATCDNDSEVPKEYMFQVNDYECTKSLRYKSPAQLKKMNIQRSFNEIFNGEDVRKSLSFKSKQGQDANVGAAGTKSIDDHPLNICIKCEFTAELAPPHIQRQLEQFWYEKHSQQSSKYKNWAYVPSELLCSRCARHYKLYELPWPYRHPSTNPQQNQTPQPYVEEQLMVESSVVKKPKIGGDRPSLDNHEYLCVFVDPAGDPVYKYWWPGVIIPADKAPAWIKPSNLDVVVRYFEDASWGTVPLSAMRIFTLESEPYVTWQQDQKIKTLMSKDIAIERATQYIKYGRFPSSWNFRRPSR